MSAPSTEAARHRSAVSGPDAEKTAASLVRAYAMLFLLFAVSTLSFLSSSIFSLLVEPMKQDLKLDDLQISLLLGAAFTIFSATMVFPLAYIADRWSRRGLISIAICVWSVMTALSALAHNFGWLFAARMGVGLGGAAFDPASYSLLGDIFPRKRIGRALSVYAVSAPVGQGLALVLGGMVLGMLSRHGVLVLPVLGPLPPWRTALLSVGLASTVIGLLFLLIPEPPHPIISQPAAVRVEGALKFVLRERRMFLPLFLGLGLIGAAVFGTTMWAPTLFLRTFGIPADASALPIGLAIGIGGATGMLVGGIWGDRLFAKGEKDAYIRVVLYSVLLALPFFTLAPLMPFPSFATACLGVATFFQCLQAGHPVAFIQSITPNHLRARVLALYICFISLFVFGLGPTVIALASRYLFSEQRLFQSMALSAFVQLTLASIAIGVTRRRYCRPGSDQRYGEVVCDQSEL